MTWPPDMRTVLALPDNPLQQCGCGRVTNADMMVDVRPLPEVARGRAEWVCDACLETLFREKRITREDFYTALGAPAALLKHVKDGL